MMETKSIHISIQGEIVDGESLLSLAELSRACHLPAERIIEWVDEGIIEPEQKKRSSLYFKAIAIKRIRCAQRLVHDLGVNHAGAALALELIEEVANLRDKLAHLEKQDSR